MKSSSKPDRQIVINPIHYSILIIYGLTRQVKINSYQYGEFNL